MEEENFNQNNSPLDKNEMQYCKISTLDQTNSTNNSTRNNSKINYYYGTEPLIPKNQDRIKLNNHSNIIDDNNNIDSNIIKDNCDSNLLIQNNLNGDISQINNNNSDNTLRINPKNEQNAEILNENNSKQLPLDKGNCNTCTKFMKNLLTHKICNYCYLLKNCLCKTEYQHLEKENPKEEINDDNGISMVNKIKEIKEFKLQTIERFFIGKKYSEKNKNKSNENVIEQNLELEKKLKQIEEENKSLKIFKKIYTELENKYKKLVLENKEFQTKTKNIIETLIKIGKIENQTKNLIINNKLLFDNLKKSINEKITINNNILDYKKTIKTVYLKYLFFKKLVKQNNILKIYFNKFKDIITSLKLIEEEQNRILRKNKKLKDLFYGKIIERKNRIHRYFTKFYYKGLLNSMQNQIAKDSINEQLEKNKIETEENISSENKKIENEIENDNTKNNINIDKKNEKSEIKKEQEENNNKVTIVNEEESKIENDQKVLVIPRQRARNIRKLLNKKNKERIEILRKYFYLFQCNGIMAFIRNSSRRSTQKPDEKMQESLKIALEEEKAKKNKEEELNKKLEDEKRKKNEKEKYLEKLHKIQVIVGKKERNITIITRKYFEKWNLIAKILGINESLGKKNKLRSKKGKKIKKNKIKKDVNNEKEGNKIENI